MLPLGEETAVQAVVGSIVWAFRRLKKPRCREMSARGYALHSVCPLHFPSYTTLYMCFPPVSRLLDEIEPIFLKICCIMHLPPSPFSSYAFVSMYSHTAFFLQCEISIAEHRQTAKNSVCTDFLCCIFHTASVNFVDRLPPSLP